MLWSQASSPGLSGFRHINQFIVQGAWTPEQGQSVCLGLASWIASQGGHTQGGYHDVLPEESSWVSQIWDTREQGLGSTLAPAGSPLSTEWGESLLCLILGTEENQAEVPVFMGVCVCHNYKRQSLSSAVAQRGCPCQFANADLSRRASSHWLGFVIQSLDYCTNHTIHLWVVPGRFAAAYRQRGTASSSEVMSDIQSFTKGLWYICRTVSGRRQRPCCLPSSAGGRGSLGTNRIAPQDDSLSLPVHGGLWHCWAADARLQEAGEVQEAAPSGQPHQSDRRGLAGVELWDSQPAHWGDSSQHGDTSADCGEVHQVALLWKEEGENTFLPDFLRTSDHHPLPHLPLLQWYD